MQREEEEFAKRCWRRLALNPSVREGNSIPLDLLYKWVSKNKRNDIILNERTLARRTDKERTATLLSVIVKRPYMFRVEDNKKKSRKLIKPIIATHNSV